MEDIHGIKPLMEVAFPWAAFISLLGLLLGLFLLFWWLIWRWLRQRKAPETETESEPKISPREAALEALAKLKAANFIAQGKFPSFYLELEAIFKGFLEDVYGKPVRSYTRQELLSFMEKRDRDQAMPDFSPVLERGIFAKFARSQIEAQEMNQDFDYIKDFIQNYPIPKPISKKNQPGKISAS